ncbi:MAG: hypothetical protein AB1649_30795 [Chloroflexota bacterium]
MAQRKLALLITSIALIASLMACTSLGKLSLSNPRMAFDEPGMEETTVYPPFSDFHAVADLYNAPSGTEVSAKWYAVDVDGYEPDSLLDETILTIEDESYTGHVSFEYTYDDVRGWPPGKYKVELYLNGELMHTLNFVVQ